VRRGIFAVQGYGRSRKRGVLNYATPTLQTLQFAIVGTAQGALPGDAGRTVQVR
jgi:hypothetical protein